MAIAAIALSGCGGKPFNVKPEPTLQPRAAPAGPGAEARSAVAAVRARAVKDEDYLFDTFDANLIMAGVLPVMVTVTNTGAEPLDLDRARFEIRAWNGRGYKADAPRKAYERLVSYYGITTYSKDGYNESREDFSSHALDFETPLAAGQSRDGLIFFPVPSDVAGGQGLRLLITRLGHRRAATV
jgi:hypothetical protein